jgi:hypothetical protein
MTKYRIVKNGRFGYAVQRKTWRGWRYVQQSYGMLGGCNIEPEFLTAAAAEDWIISELEKERELKHRGEVVVIINPVSVDLDFQDAIDEVRRCQHNYREDSAAVQILEGVIVMLKSKLRKREL